MKLLADTQALVWYSMSDQRLTATARTLLSDPANEVFVSPASYWEIAIKVHLGKWNVGKPYPDLIDDWWRVYGFRELAICPDQTARLIGLPNHHGDPFDRLIVVQALADGLTLVSIDTVFDRYGVPRVWA